MSDNVRRTPFTCGCVCIIVEWYDAPEGLQMRVTARGDESCLLPMLAEGHFGKDARAYRLIGEPEGYEADMRKKLRTAKGIADGLVSAIP